MSWKSKLTLQKKQYQKLHKPTEFNKKEGDETINKDDKKPTHKKYIELDLGQKT